MEAKAYIKNLKISPKKLRFMLPEIKKLKPTTALEKLNYQPKKPAKIFYKAIKSALTNAKSTLKISEEMLKFKLLTVEEGRKLKRFQPGGRGTVKSILKRYAHIKIVLTVDKEQPTNVSKLKSQNLKLRQTGSKPYLKTKKLNKKT